MNENMKSDQNLIGRAQQFNETINTLRDQFFSTLIDFKKYYVYYNKNPEVNEFQNYYSNSKSQLQTMSKNLFLATNDIDKNIELLNKQMMDVSRDLEREMELNETLTEQLKNLNNVQDGSEVLVDDAKTKYNIQYYNNWEMFIGILIISGLMVKIFKKPNPV